MRAEDCLAVSSHQIKSVLHLTWDVFTRADPGPVQYITALFWYQVETLKGKKAKNTWPGASNKKITIFSVHYIYIYSAVTQEKQMCMHTGFLKHIRFYHFCIQHTFNIIILNTSLQVWVNRTSSVVNAQDFSCFKKYMYLFYELLCPEMMKICKAVPRNVVHWSWIRRTQSVTFDLYGFPYSPVEKTYWRVETTESTQVVYQLHLDKIKKKKSQTNRPM